MPHRSGQWKRNTEGLRKNAQEKALATKRRVEEAIRLLLKEQRVINFKTVAEAARVSTAWLYANEDVKARITHLRSQQNPKAQVRIPPQQQASNASKDAVIKTLQKRIEALQNRVNKQADEIKELKGQLEIAHGQLQKQYLQS
jgi:hypothetical protein